jgi:2-phospho-L-lactate transferase/gluconeogenesis factor (CofD/UPF0052 family)
VLPNLLVRDIRDAVRASQAVKLYVSNVATQHGETDGFSVADLVAALIAYVLANENVAEELPEAWHSRAVAVNGHEMPHVRVVLEDVVREDKRYHHDPAKLAAAVIRLYYDREPAASAPQAVTVR